MILVIVGLMYSFDRLAKKMDEISENIDEKVVMLIGNSEYIPKNAVYHNFLDEDEYIKLLDEAKIVVSHAGIGTIISVMNHNKPLILVPRQQEFGEHLDNHQMEVAYEFEDDARFDIVIDIDDLEKTIIKRLEKNLKELNNGNKSRELGLRLREYILKNI